MGYYQKCFGGELGITTIGETTVAHLHPVDKQANVVTSVLCNGQFVIMGADADLPLQRNCSAVTLTVELDDSTECATVFEKLADGGNVLLPLTEQFWGAVSGVVKDRYDIYWLLYYRTSTASSS